MPEQENSEQIVHYSGHFSEIKHVSSCQPQPLYTICMKISIMQSGFPMYIQNPDQKHFIIGKNVRFLNGQQSHMSFEN